MPLQTTAPLTDFTYAGMFYNADSGLDLTQYRIYNPAIGRWLSRDPLGEGTDPAANLYRYAGGNPVTWIDPTGLAIGDYPPPPPGYNSTWTTGQWDNGNYYVVDPKTGDIYTAHPEDAGHWPHWDKQPAGGGNQSQCPRNSSKPRPGQIRAPYGGQSLENPNDPTAAPWQPPPSEPSFAPEDTPPIEDIPP